MTAKVRRCTKCRRLSEPGGRYCTACGTALTDRAKPTIVRAAPYLITGLFGLALVILWIQPSRAPAGESDRAFLASPLDISNLTPRQRFDRLYQRVIAAAQSGDQQTVERFTPMAFGAYEQLDSVDVDIRYHLAMLQLHIGDFRGATAQADSIRELAPSHLFGPVIDAAITRWTKDEASRNARYREFLSRYDSELAVNRREYQEHAAMLREVKRVAEATQR